MPGGWWQWVGWRSGTCLSVATRLTLCVEVACGMGANKEGWQRGGGGVEALIMSATVQPGPTAPTHPLAHYLRVCHTRKEVSPRRRPPNDCRTKNSNARAQHSAPTTMYAMPRKGFLPPRKEVVDTTMLFLPSNVVTGKLRPMENVSVVPAGMLVSMRPYSLRKLGRAAARIHTIKCSSVTSVTLG